MGFREEFARSYRESGEAVSKRVYSRWYQIGHVAGFTVANHGLRYVYRPLLFGTFAAIAWRLIGGNWGAVESDVFALLGGTIPALAIPIFVVLERAGIAIDGEVIRKAISGSGPVTAESERAVNQAVAGLGIGLQMMVSEVLCIYAVAISSTSRTLALVISACVLAQILWLTTFTFGTLLAPRPPRRDSRDRDS